MRTFVIICYFDVDLVLKKIAFFLSVACATAILYGNLPARRISLCEQQGVSESVCTAAEWDNEKVNLLPGYDPEYMKANAELQTQTRADKTVAIKA
ncbi:TPA: hypothetical protein SBQ34_001511 [Raoultella ornithinolytica]|jgi:hypothetical protein|uniref:Uncharacterized protein n=1 Tax=Raoultella ornithinolytica TaxID=54291 RepID=A0ABZ2E432_RAOOR|nr:hypothetical protein [Raoultella ornithinolytica]EHT10080.1 hypothetical protein HMPREF9690_02090 [Raoultella ornithinolytica 10-5246]EKU2860405.1 hypothetical protein [Raoultella ornithinolytica]EKU8632519.1 hypothetical protein [Raoultella ornithinolytica]ELS0893410.1 hypothetical protein [Raoultella ornithinolytica]MCF6684728.1 hypothetical protein [Raoultella ornithinolytica]